MKVIDIEKLFEKHSNNPLIYDLLKRVIDEEEVIEINDMKLNNKETRTTFKKLGIPVGSLLFYKEDDSIICKVADDNNKVLYKNNYYTLSRLVRELKMSPTNVYNSYNGFKFFTYRGRTLTEIRDDIMMREVTNNG